MHTKTMHKSKARRSLPVPPLRVEPPPPELAPAPVCPVTQDALRRFIASVHEAGREDCGLDIQASDLGSRLLQGEPVADEAISCAQALIKSGRALMGTLTALSPPSCLPSEDRHALRFAIEEHTAGLRYRERATQVSIVMTTLLMPFGGRIVDVPAERFPALEPSVIASLEDLALYRELQSFAFRRAAGILNQVLTRWGVADV